MDDRRTALLLTRGQECRRDAGVESGSTMTTSSAGAMAIVTTYFGDAPVRCLTIRPSAGCTSRATSLPASSPKAPKRCGLRLLLPAAHRRCLWQAVPGGWRHHGHVQRPAGSAGVMEYFTTPRIRLGLVGDWWRFGCAPDRHAWTCTERNWSEVSPIWCTTPTSFRFDGSDLMPGEVGAGSFWKGMTD